MFYTKERNFFKINELILLLKFFCICHKGFIVHMDYIKDINHNSVQLMNQQIIPISRSQKEAFKKLYNRYLLTNK
ncbi:MAG: LytTR family transcriptional regulator DNA-binding domain-containing protein [Faecalibacillus sp.]